MSLGGNSESLRRMQEESRRRLQDQQQASRRMQEESLRGLQDQQRRSADAAMRQSLQQQRDLRRRRRKREFERSAERVSAEDQRSARAATGHPYVLVGVNGSQRGVEFLLRDGEVGIGREADNAVVLPESEVSRHHARLSVRGDAVEIEDLGSRNHTRVNGALVRERQALRPGAVIDVASVRFELRSASSAASGSSGASSNSARFDVGGQTGGTINNVGRDQIYDLRRRSEFYYEGEPDPFFEAASGAGFPRFLIIVGLLLALAGFGLWMYVIFGAASDPDAALEAGGFGPLAPVGFATFAGGGILASIGTGMARARRRAKSQRWE